MNDRESGRPSPFDGADRPAERRNNAKGAARREALIEAAVRLFSERGFRGTGIIGLAKEVGMTHVGLLHHFGTKEHLLREVVSRRDSAQVGIIGDMLGRRGLDAIRILDEVGAGLVADPTLTRLFAVLLAENLQPDDPLNTYFRERHFLTRYYFESAVKTGQQDGEIRPDAVPATIGAEILGFVTGMQSAWLLDPSIDLTAAFSGYTDRLVADLAVAAADRLPADRDRRSGGPA